MVEIEKVYRHSFISHKKKSLESGRILQAMQFGGMVYVTGS